MDKCDFDKYDRATAIHWTALNRHVKKHGLAFDARYRKCVELLESVVNPGANASILDLGCGDGALFYYLHKAFPNAVLNGIDGSEEGLKLAGRCLQEHSVNNVHLIKLDFDDLGSVAQQYDIIISLEVIEHLHDPRDFLRNIARMLSAGGHVVLSTPIRLREFPKDKDHVKEYFPAEFRMLAESAGFDVLQHDQITPIYYLIRYFHPIHLGIGKSKLLMKLYNALNILFQYNIFLAEAPGGSYELYETQFILARKNASLSGSAHSPNRQQWS